MGAHAMGKKKKSSTKCLDQVLDGGKGFKKKCCDKPLRKMCKRCPRRAGL